MVLCPHCNANVDVEEDELDEGDTLSCDECGATIRVAGLNPLELESEGDEDGEEGEEDLDEDGEDDDEEDEEDKEEDEW